MLLGGGGWYGRGRWYWTLARRYGTPRKTRPSGAAPDEIEKTSMFDRADLAPKTW